MQSRQRQKIIFGLIGSIGVVLTLAVLILYSKEYWFLKYHSNRYGFSVRYPAQGALTENKDGAAVIFSSPMATKLDTFSENVNIVVQDISSRPMDLQKYTQTAIHQMQVVFEQNLEIVESSPAMLAGLPAHKFVFIGKGPDTELQFMSVWTLDDLTAYQVTYTAPSSGYAQYLVKAQGIINSFSLK